MLPYRINGARGTHPTPALAVQQAHVRKESPVFSCWHRETAEHRVFPSSEIVPSGTFSPQALRQHRTVW
jgi:hypothetical protein